MKKIKSFFHPNILLLQENHKFIYDFECAASGDLDDRLWVKGILIEAVKYYQLKGFSKLKIYYLLLPYFNILKSSQETNIYNHVVSMIESYNPSSTDLKVKAENFAIEACKVPIAPDNRSVPKSVRPLRLFLNKKISYNNFDYSSLDPKRKPF